MAYLFVLQQLVEVAQTVERLSNRNKKVRCENKQIGREAGKHYRVPSCAGLISAYVPWRRRLYRPQAARSPELWCHFDEPDAPI
jgi:hypothetical protein